MINSMKCKYKISNNLYWENQASLGDSGKAALYGGDVVAEKHAK